MINNTEPTLFSQHVHYSLEHQSSYNNPSLFHFISLNFRKNLVTMYMSRPCNATCFNPSTMTPFIVQRLRQNYNHET